MENPKSKLNVQRRALYHEEGMKESTQQASRCMLDDSPFLYPHCRPT